MLTMEEMEEATTEVTQLSKGMAEIRSDAEEINEEEGLLDLEVSPYITLPGMTSMVNTLDTLWNTVLTFHKNYEILVFRPVRGPRCRGGEGINRRHLADVVQNIARAGGRPRREEDRGHGPRKGGEVQAVHPAIANYMHARVGGPPLGAD